MRRALGLLILSALAVSGCAVWEQARLVGCVAWERLTDPPGVRTDGLCLLEYWVREGIREDRREEAP